jgi:light-regulated signal transduction histidine kinase (bacteriophytochrome)
MQPEASSPDISRRLERLERRLEILGKICRHDLPNRLVVIRGLVNLLLEESGKLGSEGQEYARRLSAASERALDLMQTVKTLLAVDALADKPEEIDVPDLARELARETKQLLPGADVEYQFSFTVRKVHGIRRSVHKVMGELLRHSLGEGRAKAFVEMGSRSTEQGAEISLAIAPNRIALEPALASSREDSTATEKQLEVLVARELVESWGGDLRTVEIPGKGIAYALLIPGCQR